ncbi:MAG TPA: hypothetical protein VJI96_02095 [Candidatus Andersenbacteria bacterium]|nr:hypothetical protein [Candidatus Andersenbacteria bacterium]
MKLYEKIYISFAYLLGVTQILLFTPEIFREGFSLLLLLSSPGLNLICLATILFLKKSMGNIAGFISIFFMLETLRVTRIGFNTVFLGSKYYIYNDMEIAIQALWNIPMFVIIGTTLVFVAFRSLIAKKVV